MYGWFSQLSAFFSEPITALVYSSRISLIAALLLGLLGSLAPCQISANLGAITYFGQRHLQKKLSWSEIPLYLAGKIIVYSSLCGLVWLFGQSISNEAIPFFAAARKWMGPLFLVMGLFMLGVIRLPGNVGFRLSQRIDSFSKKVGGSLGAFLFGVAFSIAFCPTMFWLFFGLFMPMVGKSPYGIVLPSVFAIGTAIPLLFFIGVYVGVGLDRVLVRKAKIWGLWVQRVAGAVFLLIGVNDTITYFFIV
jgi:hypothetical protein